MKNYFKRIYVKYVVAIVIAAGFSLNLGATNTIFDSKNQQSGNSIEGQSTNSMASDESIWGKDQSTMFNNTGNSGTRQLAPFTPDEPGETCVPVPDGIWLMLGLALIYGLRIVLFKRKENVI